MILASSPDPIILVFNCTSGTLASFNPTRSASAINFTMSIGADAAATRIIGTNATVGNIAANSVQQFYGSWPVQPTEIVTVSASTGAVLVLVVTGERRTLG